MTTRTLPASLLHPDVEVRVSTRRKKTAGAHWEGDRIVVVVPAHLRGVELDAMVADLSRRLRRSRPQLHASDEALAARAAELGRTYLDGVAPSSIRWSSRQRKRWGSCTIATREIRISDRLRSVPPWVLDSVIVHELAHLLEPNHSPRFRVLEDRYPRRREAELFLAGYHHGLHADQAGGPPPADDGLGADELAGGEGGAGWGTSCSPDASGGPSVG
jgi:hypothetical protein